MSSGVLVRLRPAGPWRIGSESGNPEHLETLFHSDGVYSAVTAAMREMGMLEEWLGATALAGDEPVVRFTSCFPWQGETFFVVPPRTIWPAASARLRTKGAQFIPVSLASQLIGGAAFEEDRWVVDGWSRCLLPAAGGTMPVGPFRHATRSFAAVDRSTRGQILTHRTACLEFAANAGLWCSAAFSTEEARNRWSALVEGAFRLLADTGMGGRRSIGWGRSEVPEFRTCSLQEFLLPARESQSEPVEREAAAGPFWLLSLFSPGSTDTVDWSRGSYSLLDRGGRVEGAQERGRPKKMLRMVEEGSVLYASSSPSGAAPDVAPAGFPHPVFRYGRAVAVSIADWTVAVA